MEQGTEPMSGQTPTGATVKVTPPYTSFSSFKTLLKNLKEHGIPSRIDRSVLGNSFSNAVGSQILTALKFLSLTTDDNQPTQWLKPLVDEFGTEEWKSSLRVVLERAYAPLFALDLEKASPAQFSEKFRSAYSGTDEVQRKSVTFFLTAAKESDVKISPYIMKNKKPRSAAPKKRAPKEGKPAAQNLNGGNNNQRIHDPKPDNEGKLPSELLLGLFHQKMQKEEQDALWTLIKFYKASGQ